MIPVSFIKQNEIVAEAVTSTKEIKQEGKKNTEDEKYLSYPYFVSPGFLVSLKRG